ncbi:MAG TPA: 50S ribosomal protein L21 [Candidatus Pacearchaeota archaeon]|jgi:large subunit ribosomal protein L21|nr:50S ribosomal protein L21 [Candidatus Pacearchaeota archaeon]HQG09411.1 50S ribosomal protein L21 [Candidatus Pacearchaeota archaeon]HQH20266.1 50S ribosomal protein L21 [Candidatus Pacearchaeota archaeon]HQK58512.1 50S ribosomal protein L21 [Candidatus Pacearchaeota archaeon]
MLAVIKTGGKQYKVTPGQKIKIEKLNGEEGKEVTFEEVLLVENDNDVVIGDPLVKNAKVLGKILKQDKHDKVIIYKYKPKKRYKVKKGHRQPYTEVEILKIEA